MTSAEIEARARAVPPEERPVPTARLSSLGAFLGIYGGEHIAATEFVIGALLVTWGVRASELLLGLVVGNFLATLMYAVVCAPIAVDTRLSLFASCARRRDRGSRRRTARRGASPRSATRPR